MTGLPSVACPCCNVQLPLEAWISNAATREAFLSLAALHPSQRLPMTAMRYVGLFAPARQTMRWDRIADLLMEIRDLISSGRVEYRHQNLPAPMDYWLNAMEECLTRRATLTLPLTSHGYLKSIVVGYSSKAEAKAEQHTEQTRQGHAGTGGAAQRAERTGKAEMPSSVRDVLKQISNQKGAQ